jgi:DNA-binding MarR family transcriptional regulator
MHNDEQSIQQTAERLSNNLARLLMEFHKDFSRRIIEEVHRRGYSDIRPSHSAVFGNIGLGTMRVTELATRAGVTQQAMGKMLKELERMGYVLRDIDSADRRAKAIRLTEKGQRLFRDSLDIVNQLRRDYAQRIGGDDLDRLEELLQSSLRKINLNTEPDYWLD